MVVVQSLSYGQLFVTPWTAAHQASLFFTVSWSLLKLMSIESRLPFNHLIHYCPLLLLPSIFPNIRGFSNESAFYIRKPNFWSFNFSISPSDEYSKLISFRIDWFDLISLLQGITKGLSRVFSSTTIQKYQFFGTQPSLWSNFLIRYWKNHSFDYMNFSQQSDVSIS